MNESRHHLENCIRLRPQRSLGAYVSLGIMARHKGDPGNETYFRFCRWELLRTARNPPQGIDEAILLLHKADDVSYTDR